MNTNLKDDVATVHCVAGDFEVHSAGAHVTRWKTPEFGEMIFVSAFSGFGVGVPVRGGIPVCFPWFGDPTQWDDEVRLLGGQYAKFKHGFAREVNWRLVESAVNEGGGVVPTNPLPAWSATYELTEEDVETQGYPGVAPFLAIYRIDFSADALDLTFAVVNTGEETFRFEAALHTYFQVGDVSQVEILGLEGVEYVDNAAQSALETQVGPLIFRGEVDNIYQSEGDVTIVDPARDVRTVIRTADSETTVVWNPGPSGASAMADMGDEEWREFVCVESANARAGAVVLEPGQTHVMRANYRVGR